MISLNDVKNAVIKALRESELIQIDTITGEVLEQKEGSGESFLPMLQVQVLPTGSEVKAAGLQAGRNMMIDISYVEELPVSRAVLYGMLDTLDRIFMPVLRIGDRNLTVQDIRRNITDDIAHYMFSITFDDCIPYEETEPAGELQVTIGI